MRIVLLLLLFPIVSFAETEPAEDRLPGKGLTIRILDVVHMQALDGCTLELAGPEDTLTLRGLRSATLLVEETPPGYYTLTVSKAGYTSVAVSWDYSGDSATVLVECYLVKENLSKPEKQHACRLSKAYAHHHQSSDPNSGGFELFKPGRKSVFVSMVEIRKPNDSLYRSYEGVRML